MIDDPTNHDETPDPADTPEEEITLNIGRRPLVEPLPDMDETTQGQIAALVNWVSTSMLIACNRTDDSQPTPLQFVGQALPHPKLMELLQAGIASMARNAYRASGGQSRSTCAELIAQCLHREGSCDIEPARAYAEEFLNRIDADEDEELKTMCALTSDGFLALAAVVFGTDDDTDDDERTPQQDEADIEALRQIAVGARVIMGSVLHILIDQLDTILDDLKVETTIVQRDEYRSALIDILKNVQG